MSLQDWFGALRDDAAEWTEGRSAWARVPLAAYLAYAGARHALSMEYRSWFAGLTLILHEIGHMVFSPFGRTLMLLGGSIFQLLCPFAAALYLLFRQRDWFGLAVCVSWLSFSTFELAVYVDDANKGELPLVGMGEDVIHDWDALLTQWHVLNSAQTFATILRGLALVEWGLAMALTAWLFNRMWRSTTTLPPPD